MPVAVSAEPPAPRAELQRPELPLAPPEMPPARPEMLPAQEVFDTLHSEVAELVRQQYDLLNRVMFPEMTKAWCQ